MFSDSASHMLAFFFSKSDLHAVQHALDSSPQDLIEASIFVSICPLGLHDILHAKVMRISSVKPVPWLAVNLHHLFSNGAAFNTQSRSSLTSYAIRVQNRRWIAFDNERDIV